MFIKRYSLLNNLIVFLTPTSHAAIGLALKQVFVEKPRTQLYCGDVSPLLGQPPAAPCGSQLWFILKGFGGISTWLDRLLTRAEHRGAVAQELRWGYPPN